MIIFEGGIGPKTDRDFFDAVNGKEDQITIQFESTPEEESRTRL